MKLPLLFLVPILISCNAETARETQNASEETKVLNPVKIGMSTAEMMRILGKTEKVGVWIWSVDSAGENRKRVVNAYHYSPDSVVFVEVSGDTVFALDFNYKADNYKL